MSVRLTVVVVLTAFLFVLQVGNLASMHASDPFGRGMSSAFGIPLSIGLWLLLAAMLIAARTRDAFPSFSGWAVLILMPVSLAAMLETNSLFQSTLSPRWLIISAAVPPFLLALFAIALCVPILRPRVQSVAANGAIWGSVLLLSVIPWFEAVRQSRAIAADNENAEMQEKAEHASRREQFALLTSNSPLAEWLEFAMPGDDTRDEALARMRELPHRQRDAEALVAEGNGVILELVPALDLKPTPTLARHAREFVLALVKSFPGPAENPNALGLSAHRLERYGPAIEWFCRRSAGDFAPVLKSLEAFARAHPDSPERTSLLREIERWRRLG
jgi:hypothetical protein